MYYLGVLGIKLWTQKSEKVTSVMIDVMDKKYIEISLC